MQRFMSVLISLVCSLCCGRKEAVVEEPSPGHTVTIRAGDIRAVFVDNTEFGAHPAWYNGVASLTHKADTVNIFRPRVAGRSTFSTGRSGGSRPRCCSSRGPAR